MKLWEPTKDQIESSVLNRFMQHVRANEATELSNYHDLHQWSVDSLSNFGVMFGSSPVLPAKDRWNEY